MSYSCEYCGKSYVQGCWDLKEANYCGNISKARLAELNSLNRADALTARVAELEGKLAAWEDMIDNCAGVPRNPDSLPMMLLYEIRRALAQKAPPA